MHSTHTLDKDPLVADDLSRLERLQHVIDHAAHLLPAQGPITVFIHHNTLHAFEHLPFDDAVEKGARLFGCQPYLTEDRFREKFARGRIQSADLFAELRADLGQRAEEPVLGFGSRLVLRLAMLEYPLRLAPAAELRWFVAETDALRKFRSDAPAGVRERFIKETRHWAMRDLRGPNGERSRKAHDPHDRKMHEEMAGLFEHFGETSIEKWSDATWEAFSLQALWRICREGVHGVKASAHAPSHALRHRDRLLEVSGTDSDPLVNDVLIRFSAAFLDQGFSDWPLPNRDQGFYRAFCALYQQPGGPPDRWLRGLAAELRRLDNSGLSPQESILESLDVLAVAESHWEDYVTATLLALRGWTGMIQQVELRGDRVAHAVAAGSLVEFLAVRLILDRLALSWIAADTLDFTGPLDKLQKLLRGKLQKHRAPNVEQRAFLVFQLAQVLGWLPADLSRLSKQEWSQLVGEIEAFSGLERRRIMQRAFERHYRTQALDAVSIHARNAAPPARVVSAQAIFCLDEREESMRRHLEEIAPDVETWSAAGFFSVAMYYRGLTDAHYVPLCPVVIRPQHWVVEDVVFTLEQVHQFRAKARRVLGAASHKLHLESRTFTGGALLTTGFGMLASIPLVSRVLFPRLTARIRRLVGRLIQPPHITQLRLERSVAEAGTNNEHVGFTLEEMVDIAERLLRDTGLTSGFARLVAVIGHGSSSVNNPHKSAYDCGACCGSSGGPNARALAQILNDPRVRQRLLARGLTIPGTTVVVGALHNTCNDSVTFLDLDRLPHTHQQEFEAFQLQIEEACDRNAHERCRRFQSAPLNMSFRAARRHVEGRSEDLAQTRPECGHATNAICFVGRRNRTRGLYMDRRTFLTSYDPTQDTGDRAILTRILQAVFPVCGGINLEYYFSYVDPAGWGCGTKLPHNVTSLLGVMDGATSDLRTGLPWQMVEIHEPVRLLFIIEQTPEAMLQILDRQPAIGQLCRNGWVQLAVLSPDSPDIQLFRDGVFQPYQPETTELPTAPSSADWYRGWRDHLGFAEIKNSH